MADPAVRVDRRAVRRWEKPYVVGSVVNIFGKDCEIRSVRRRVPTKDEIFGIYSIGAKYDGLVEVYEYVEVDPT